VAALVEGSLLLHLVKAPELLEVAVFGQAVLIEHIGEALHPHGGVGVELHGRHPLRVMAAKTLARHLHH